jgi:hypothetical protein
MSFWTIAGLAPSLCPPLLAVCYNVCRVAFELQNIGDPLIDLSLYL